MRTLHTSETDHVAGGRRMATKNLGVHQNMINVPPLGGGGGCISPSSAQTVMSWATSDGAQMAFGMAGAAVLGFLTDGASTAFQAAATSGGYGIASHLESTVANETVGNGMDAYNDLVDAANYIDSTLENAGLANPGSYYAQDQLNNDYYDWACQDLGI